MNHKVFKLELAFHSLSNYGTILDEYNYCTPKWWMCGATTYNNKYKCHDVIERVSYRLIS